MVSAMMPSMLRPLGMGRWTMAVRATMGLSLGYYTKAQGQCCSDSHRRSPTLKLHGAYFLSEKDSSSNGCHNAIMQDKTALWRL